MIYRNGYGPIDRFCAKHPRFGISNLMLYIVIGQVAVFILDLFFRGMLSSYWLPFSRDLILHGQVWRLVTFIFLPSDSGNPFFLLLGCYFYYWIGTMLEREWGTARFTLFYLSGVVLSVLSGMILGITDIYYINLSIFLVIATLYGEMQVLLFFVIPIKMKWMALIDVALILVAVIQNLMYGSWVGALLPLASFVNYFIFTWPFWGAKLGVLRRRTLRWSTSSGCRSRRRNRPRPPAATATSALCAALPMPTTPIWSFAIAPSATGTIATV